VRAAARAAFVGSGYEEDRLEEDAKVALRDVVECEGVREDHASGFDVDRTNAQNVDCGE